MILHLDCKNALINLLDADIQVDSIVTDPPYEMGFMGKSWDKTGIAYDPELWELCFHILKPGGHLLSFGGARTYHRMTCAIEDAGFEIRDQIMWVYGSGFPKSLNISKSLDKMAGAEREIIGTRLGLPGMAKDGLNQRSGFDHAYGGEKSGSMSLDITAPATDAAKQWDGWGTALKPAHESIVLARKPLSEKTIAENVLKHGTGGLNVDACRVYSTGKRPYNISLNKEDILWEKEQSHCGSHVNHAEKNRKLTSQEIKGFSVVENVGMRDLEEEGAIHADINKLDTGCCGGMKKENTNTSLSIEEFGKTQTVPCQKGMKYTTSTQLKQTTDLKTSNALESQSIYRNIKENISVEKKTLRLEKGKQGNIEQECVLGRFPANLIHDGSEEVEEEFAKYGESRSSSAIRNNSGKNKSVAMGNEYPRIGFGHADNGTASRFFYSAKASKKERNGSKHPTVKPLALMRYLCRLATPPGGTVLDPFAGTGTTGEAAKLEGFNYILIEKEAQYIRDIEKRLYE